MRSHRRAPACRASERIWALRELPASAPTIDRAIAWSRPWSGPHVLAVHRSNVELFRVLRRMWVIGALVDAKIAELDPSERPARQHALDRLFDDPLREAPLHDRLGGALLDAADVTGVVVIDLLLQLAAGQHHLLGIDDDDVVAAIDMRRVGRLVFAAQPHGDDRSEAADDQTLAIDHHPLL